MSAYESNFKVNSMKWVDLDPELKKYYSQWCYQHNITSYPDIEQFFQGWHIVELDLLQSELTVATSNDKLGLETSWFWSDWLHDYWLQHKKNNITRNIDYYHFSLASEPILYQKRFYNLKLSMVNIVSNGWLELILNWSDIQNWEFSNVNIVC